MKTIYLAGPIGFDLRIATVYAFDIAKIGGILTLQGWDVFVPHWSAIHPYNFTNVPRELWLASSLRWALKCDAICMCLEWQKSDGSLAELEAMIENNKEIYEWQDRLVEMQ